MRILHIYKDYYPVLGGIENHIRTLAEAQIRFGHEVTILVTNPSSSTVDENLNGVRLIKVGRIATVASTPLSPDFPRTLRSLSADITHLHIPYPVGEVSQMLAGPNRPYIATYHADATRPVQRLILRLYGPVFRRFLRRAARILPTSANYAASSPYLRHVTDQITVVPLGVNAHRFTPRASPNPPDGHITLLFVGLLRHYKGLDDLIRAMPSLPSETRLHIAGNGPMRAKWESLAQALQLQDRVKFLGRVPDAELPALYRAADIFVLPANTRAEAFGTVLLEAMASGLPCITTEVGSGTSYVVQEGVTGFTVPPHSPQALAEAARRLITGPALRVQFGLAGRERVVKEFTEDKMIERVEAVYQAVLAGSNAQASRH